MLRETLLAALLALTCCSMDDLTGQEINQSIGRGLDFLQGAQLDHGEFSTYGCEDHEMTLCEFDSSPFVTAQVLYSIKDIGDMRADRMAASGADFLISEKESVGIWRYWSSRNSKEIEPDLDDTAVISYVVTQRQIPLDNVNVFENNRKDELFMTWIGVADNDVDCVVNANVLLYLGDRYQGVCTYINDAIAKGEGCSTYYPDQLALYYAVSRAKNVSCLRENRDTVVRRIISQEPADALQAALTANTLMNFGYKGRELDAAIESLVREQRSDGSWPRVQFYLGPAPFYGSEELTTALSVEALNKYLIQAHH
jgi:hypothetical protein